MRLTLPLCKEERSIANSESESGENLRALQDVSTIIYDIGLAKTDMLLRAFGSTISADE